MRMLGLASPSGLDDTWLHSVLGSAGQVRLHGRLRFKPSAQASTSHCEQLSSLAKDPLTPCHSWHLSGELLLTGGYRSTSLDSPLTHAGSFFFFLFPLWCLYVCWVDLSCNSEKPKDGKKKTPYFEAFAFPEVKCHGVS